jgi:hypothetical protein
LSIIFLIDKSRLSAELAKLGAGGGERGIFPRRRAIDDEARTGQRLEHGRECRVADPVVRRGKPRPQREHAIRIEPRLIVESRAQLAARVAVRELYESVKPPLMRSLSL